MKVCEICENSFQIKQIGSGGRNRTSCYSCIPAYMDRQERNAERAKLLVEKAAKYRLSLGCSICGYANCAAALEWHHVNDDKEMQPATALKKSWSAYIIEVNKCILLCANCHREIHNPT